MKYNVVLFIIVLISLLFSGEFSSLTDNTWTRITDSPGDSLKRDVPPARGSTWAFDPNSKQFLRYGGYTPTFSNAMDAFDPVTKKWVRLFAHDENYPSTRPGGGCSWMISFDSTRNVFWLAGGWTTALTGSTGIWKYDPVAKTFAKAGDAQPWNTYYVFDPKNNVIVCSPVAGSTGGYAGNVTKKTYVFNLSSEKWEIRNTDSLPQGYYSGTHPALYDPSIGNVVVFKERDVWTYDAAVNQWGKMVTTGTPPLSKMAAFAYDPVNQVIVRYGGSDGRLHSSYIKETWVFKSTTGVWNKIDCPSIPVNALAKSGRPLFYHQAFSYDPLHKCLLLNDPDLGVWAFRYNPLSPAGTTVVDAESLVVGKAAKKAAAPGPVDILRTFPSQLNHRLINLADNTILSIPAGQGPGDEIKWDYDPDLGLLVKYGGCGNNTSPYWVGYGNDLIAFDPGTESWLTRRVGDASGISRPENGCSRSTIYDTKRKKWWFFASTSGEPYPCQSPDVVGPWSYDFSKDLFTDHKVVQTVNPGLGTCISYDPVHDLAIYPDSAKISIFDFTTMKWSTKAITGGPGRINTYGSVIWVPTMNAFLTFKGGKTLAYYPVDNRWVDLEPQISPPERDCKAGFAYDSQNDIVLLFGGYITWNSNPQNDMWAYHPSTNTWEKLNPNMNGITMAPQLGVQQTEYDSRHNVFLIAIECGRGLFAYRYKGSSVTAERAAKQNGNFNRFYVAPNPFNPSTKISFGTFADNSTPSQVKIFNANGHLVNSSILSLGSRSFVWNGRDKEGNVVSGGVYIFKIYSGKNIKILRGLLTK
ncbi:MAG: T9SS type A sorting domain-containing protein [Fibrobacteres bacterium]|nr:T9SS type A sorting domain-containing protein [Fibrobacterota bacterium]